MAARGFRLQPEAAQDIKGIWEYIAADKPPAARRVREDILQTIRQLVEHPHIGHRRLDLTNRPSASIAYLIAYAPDERPVWVVPSSMAGVIHASSLRCCEAGRLGKAFSAAEFAFS